MKAEQKFTGLPLDFWANVRLISEKVGYTERRTTQIKTPLRTEIVNAYQALGLKTTHLFGSDGATPLGQMLLSYFEHRAYALNTLVEPNLMSKEQAEDVFFDLKHKYAPRCPIPLNKQKGDKKAPAYFTGIVNILIEAHSKGTECNFDPKSLTSFTKNGFPVRSMSRRVDGAFPNVVNPIAMWEIKEYYYTTTFGSRVADGVFESLLDGYELNEVRSSLRTNVGHYLMVDGYLTWWVMGRSYLCRICDMLHMGLLTEALFGREVVSRLPVIVPEWVSLVKH